ncbi:NTPase KAP family P-loop domain-containing protein 1-like [Sardina pilchardus]|uniref:NTPase KAP family P-loop domain-containing protein 1-like n=1 Tax=Sardina pilchardus TaxID=27697 RepID=UPI002E0F3B56
MTTKDEMEQETTRTDGTNHDANASPRPVPPSLSSTLALIWRLLFFQPVWTKENQKQKNVRFVFVRFSAWHFAGSDLLWAGLVMRLCVTLQHKFGRLQLGLYRMCQHDEEAAEHKKEVTDGKANWSSKKICCIPLLLLVALVITGAMVILALLITFGFPEPEVEEDGQPEAEENAGFGVLEGFAIAALGVPAAGAVRFSFMLGKNLMVHQDFNIRRKMDNKKVSGKLGFMNVVRKEMKLLSCFIHFMEVFERRKIRVVLEITNLDRCTPEKIVGVLEAINILLSDEESPFISLLAVDPEVIVEQVNNTDCQKDQAFGFLDRIITLPFTVPPLCDASKWTVFKNIACRCSEIPIVSPPKDDEKLCERSESGEGMQLLPQTNQTEDLEVEVKVTGTDDDDDDDDVDVFQTKLHEYLSGDTMSMRRIINSFRVTTIIMEELPNFQCLPAEKVHVAAWVVLADRWPCRLSWILQCIEDKEQRTEIDQGEGMDSSMTLWQVFSKHRTELKLMKEAVEDLLERDADPELFEKFLKVDFPFTVSEAERFDQSTVNLDVSIKRKLARVRGSNRSHEESKPAPTQSGKAI